MDDWKPREHDHLVEPVFGGLGARHETRPVRESSRSLLVAVGVVAALIAARIAMLV